MAAQLILRLQPFDFAIVHRPGKHHSHADGLSRRTSRPSKRDTCPECKPLQKTAVKKTETARCFTPAFPYQRHFDGYVELSEEEALFWKWRRTQELLHRRKAWTQPHIRWRLPWLRDFAMKRQDCLRQ